MASSSSIGRRLLWLSVLSSGAALLAASLALLGFQVYEVRIAMLRQLETVAELIAFHSAPAVDFQDAEAAKATLGSLKGRPNIVSAGIVVRGRVFAMYTRENESPPEPADVLTATAGHRFTDRTLLVFRAVQAEGRPVGMLFVHSDLEEIDRTWRRFALVTAVVAVPALLLAILISQLSQRAISRPILDLASLAATVSGGKDYSVRAPAVRSAAEIEQLVSTFNQMLTEIQRQHAEIEEARMTLEQKVGDRTEELAAAYKELESFSYSVSHDLRAPLRAIDGFSKVLLSDYTERPLDQRGRHFLERVRAGTQKMSALIDDLLHLSRVTRSTLIRRDVDVSAIAEEVAAELTRRNPGRRLRCVIEPGLHAWADGHLLTIVFENLLGNAWKFTGNRDDALIEVGRIQDGDVPVFFVRDNGAGFDMAYASRLFGAFQRLHGDAEFEGTGIGLATVKRIITRHGGEVWAEAAEGKGAVFHFTLGGKS